MEATANLEALSEDTGTVTLHHTPPRNIAKVPTKCSSCNLRELCLPCGLTGQEVDRVDALVYTRRSVKRGESLGMDGIGPEIHGCNAVALEDSEVCVIPYARLVNLGHDMHLLQRQFHKVMSREIAQKRSVMLLLGTMRAEERLAAFLLNLSQRFTARGYSASEFNLRMTREEIGSYLGLKLETVSRAFSKFHEDGLIGVQQKRIRILDVAGLRSVMAKGSR